MQITGKIACLMPLSVVLIICCQSSNGQTKPHEPALDLAIAVENWADVAPRMLVTAEKVVSNIFRNAGIELNWQQASDAWSSRARPGAILQLRISRSKDFGCPEPSLGFCWQRGPDDVRAVVFLDRVEQFAQRSNASRATAAVLGCAMAHELGHLMLGSAHSNEGVMRAESDKRYVWLAAQGRLTFTPKESRLLREELYRRAHAPTSHCWR